MQALVTISGVSRSRDVERLPGHSAAVVTRDVGLV